MIQTRYELVRRLLCRRKYGTLVPFKLADIGEGIAEVEVLQWYVNEGSSVNEFDKIAEVQSDKATVEITSRYAGIIKKIHYDKGAMAKVGSALVDIEVRDEAVNDTATGPAPVASELNNSPIPTAIQENSQAEPSHRIKAMPAVRHLARKGNIDLEMVKPSGRSGQITREDVLNAINMTPSSVSSNASVGDSKLVPLTTFQRAMVKSMGEALKIPHFGYHDEFCIDRLMGLRKDLVEPIHQKFKVRMTVLAFLVKALSIALADFPMLNAHFESEETVRVFEPHNICIAVDTVHGLAVPVIRNVQSLSVVGVAQEIDRLSELARTNKLTKADLTSGTISLSNIGTVGGTTASPMIVPPQVAIVAIGRAQVLPRYNAQMQLVPQHIMPVSWSADHRIVDGATVARLSNKWRSILENPASLLINLTAP